MDVDAERRAAGHILTELGFDVGRTDEGVRGSAQVVPEMWVPGTTSLRTSILATWVDHVSGLAAIGVLAPRAGDPRARRARLRAGAVARHRPRGLSPGQGRPLVVVCGVDITDDDGHLVAIGAASFMAAPDHASSCRPTSRWTRPTTSRGLPAPPVCGTRGAAGEPGSPCSPAPTTASTPRARSTAA